MTFSTGPSFCRLSCLQKFPDTAVKFSRQQEHARGAAEWPAGRRVLNPMLMAEIPGTGGEGSGAPEETISARFEAKLLMPNVVLRASQSSFLGAPSSVTYDQAPLAGTLQATLIPPMLPKNTRAVSFSSLSLQASNRYKGPWLSPTVESRRLQMSCSW